MFHCDQRRITMSVRLTTNVSHIMPYNRLEVVAQRRGGMSNWLDVIHIDGHSPPKSSTNLLFSSAIQHYRIPRPIANSQTTQRRLIAVLFGSVYLLRGHSSQSKQ